MTMRPGEGPRDGRADRHILGNSVQPEKMFLDPITTDSRSARRLVFCLPVLGRDERHWFAAAVPGDGVHDVRTAIASLRPTEVEGRQAIRQGEWFFVPAPEVHEDARVIYRNEPLSRGGGTSLISAKS